MASTYSTNLKIELIGTGEQAGTWGTTTNTNLGTAIEQAIVGKADITMSSTTVTLTLTDTPAAQNARAVYLNLTGSPGGAADLVVPAVQKPYIVRNGSNQVVTVKVSGQTGVAVPVSATMWLYNNGTDVVNAVTNLPSGATVGGVVIGNVVGPASATDNAVARFDLTTGKLIQDSVVTIADTTGNIAGLGDITFGTQASKATLTYATNTARTLTVPNVGGNRTLSFIDEAQTLTAAQTFRAANAIRSEAASTQDAIVIAGRAGGSNSYAITLTPATLAGNRTITLPEPGSNETLGYINTPINSQSAAYTLVAADAGKTILHPDSDDNARTFTIPANSSVPYPVGTVITFVNMKNTVTIAITTDTLYLAGDGTTGSRTLAEYGVATAVKLTSTTWLISGNGLS